MKIEFNKVTWYSWTLAGIIFLVIVPVLTFYFWSQFNDVAQVYKGIEVESLSSESQLNKIIASASYECKAGKTISAIFYKGQDEPVVSGQPPKPSGSVKISLSDGRDMTLSQTISADGGRYATPNESLIFWSKGNGAFVQENNLETYSNCVENTK